MGTELFDSIVSKIAVHIPMFAKAFLEAGLERYGVNSWTATPLQMKKALDEYVLPRLRSFTHRYQETVIMGGGIIRTNEKDQIISLSSGIGQYIKLERRLDLSDPSLFKRLHEAGLVMKTEELVQIGKEHTTRRVKIERPYKSVLDVSFILITDAQTNPAGTISLVCDITLSEALAEETASLYEKLEESYERLLELDKMKSAFLDTTAHELKTPITSLKAYIEMLEDERIRAFPEREKRAYEVINRNISNLIKLIVSTLDLSRLDAGKVGFELRSCHLYDLATDVLKELKPFFERRHQNYELKIPVDIPLIYADPDKVGQVLKNLLTNAISASYDGSVIEVKARFLKKEEAVEVEVKDYGIGVLKEEQEKVFLRFYSTDSIHHFTGEADFRGQGVGLGLSISKEYIERMGGKIWLVSKGIQHEGTSLFFTLPIFKGEI